MSGRSRQRCWAVRTSSTGSRCSSATRYFARRHCSGASPGRGRESPRRYAGAPRTDHTSGRRAGGRPRAGAVAACGGDGRGARRRLLDLGAGPGAARLRGWARAGRHRRPADPCRHHLARAESRPCPGHLRRAAPALPAPAGLGIGCAGGGEPPRRPRAKAPQRRPAGAARGAVRERAVVRHDLAGHRRPLECRYGGGRAAQVRRDGEPGHADGGAARPLGAGRRRSHRPLVPRRAPARRRAAQLQRAKGLVGLPTTGEREARAVAAAFALAGARYARTRFGGVCPLRREELCRARALTTDLPELDTALAAFTEGRAR